MAASVEWAILAPLMLLCVFGIMGGGTWLHARTMARQAAATGADIVAVGGSKQQAIAAARRVASGLDDVRVDVATGADHVRVRVWGRAPLPGVHVDGEVQLWREP